MYNKTTSAKVTKYFHIQNDITDEMQLQLQMKRKDIRHKSVNRFFQYNKPVYIRCIKGIMMLALSTSGQAEDHEFFVVHRVVKINKGIHFNLISITKNATYEIFMEHNTRKTVVSLEEELSVPRIIPTFDIKEIYSYYYQVKGAPYFFSGEKHTYWELTYVDNGELKTTIDHTTYTLKEKDLIVYGPNQFHNQFIEGDHVCSYVTIMFEMNPQDALFITHRPFHLRRQLLPIMQNIMKTTTNESEHNHQLLLVYLKELILHLFNYDQLSNAAAPSTPVQQRFEDELLNEIIVYIHENIALPLTVESICLKYGLSRSTLQSLFKKNLDVAPKHYINEAKLAKSKLLIKENKYTLSEVSDLLSFNSIHYFSRSFKARFGITPSEYAKSIYK